MRATASNLAAKLIENLRLRVATAGSESAIGTKTVLRGVTEFYAAVGSGGEFRADVISDIVRKSPRQIGFGRLELRRYRGGR